MEDVSTAYKNTDECVRNLNGGQEANGEHFSSVSLMRCSPGDYDFIENTSQGVRKASSLPLFMGVQKGLILAVCPVTEMSGEPLRDVADSKAVGSAQ